jgi:pyridoxal phosphate enzyme (YggS family)
MSSFAEIKTKLTPYGASLVAVSKTKPNEQILELYQQGHRDFGENRVQELTEKQEQLPDDIRWHMIGHLQTNKVKYIAPFVHMIHSVDRAKILKEINKEAQKADRVIPCLLQFHIAEEDTKYGLDLEEAMALLESAAFQEMEHVAIAGVMGMATFTEDNDQVRREFAGLKRIFEVLKNKYFPDDEEFKEVSMGMSGDFEIALEEGSTMVRIGSLLFGARVQGY